MEKERELVGRVDKTERQMKEKRKKLVTRGVERQKQGESERELVSVRKIPGNLAALPKLNN